MAMKGSFHSACRMGVWILDMTDLDAADAAIALCRSKTSAVLEVRHSLWSVQVRTESRAAADCLAAYFAERGEVALAA